MASEWMRILPPTTIATFFVTVDGDLRARGLKPDVGLEAGVVTLPDGQQFGLENLARLCSPRPVAEWPALVHAQFDAALAPQDSIPTQFEQARPHLRLSLQPDTYGHPSATIVRWRLADGLDSVLVFDQPDSTTMVSPKDAEHWPVPLDALWRIAADNVRAESRLVPHQVPTPAGPPVTIIEAPYHYTATNALWLDQFIRLDPAKGALVGLPSRHRIVAYPLFDGSFVTVLAFYRQMLTDLHAKLPGPISPHLYWWQQGRLTRLPLDVDGTTLQFAPPPEFTATIMAGPPRR